jgi:hypothetical protein
MKSIKSKACLVLPGAILLLGIGAATGCRGPADGGAPPLPSSAEEPSASTEDHDSLLKYERFGYYLARDKYDESFQIKDIAATGMAGRLTVLAYGFGSIDPSDLTCSMHKGGDPYGDYREPFDASSSVDGVADPAVEDVPDHGGPLRGNFNQLKKLKTQFPHLQVVSWFTIRSRSRLTATTGRPSGHSTTPGSSRPRPLTSRSRACAAPCCGRSTATTAPSSTSWMSGSTSRWPTSTLPQKYEAARAGAAGGGYAVAPSRRKSAIARYGWISCRSSASRLSRSLGSGSMTITPPRSKNAATVGWSPTSESKTAA